MTDDNPTPPLDLEAGRALCEAMMTPGEWTSGTSLSPTHRLRWNLLIAPGGRTIADLESSLTMPTGDRAIVDALAWLATHWRALLRDAAVGQAWLRRKAAMESDGDERPGEYMRAVHALLEAEEACRDEEFTLNAYRAAQELKR